MSDFKDKYTKSLVGWGSAPDFAGELFYSSPPDLLVGF